MSERPDDGALADRLHALADKYGRISAVPIEELRAAVDETDD